MTKQQNKPKAHANKQYASRFSHHSNSIHSSRSRIAYSRPPRAKKFALALIIFAIIAVIVAVICSFLLTPERTVTSSIDNLARNYYENYFYPTLTSSDRFSEDVFTKYAERGFTPITLRQLLLHDEIASAGQATTIKKYCDENSTIIRFYPDPPYGKSDYHIGYTYSCNF